MIKILSNIQKKAIHFEKKKHFCKRIVFKKISQKNC